MSDAFYKFVRCVGKPVFWLSARPVVLGLEHLPPQAARPGADGGSSGCIIASTHESPYDVALLIAHAPRLLDFVSIVEVFRNPLVGWFYGSLNAFPLDRSRPDSKTIRKIRDRLRRGRAVCMFPEGGLRPGNRSVVFTRQIRPGIGRIAQISGASVIPCVIINSAVYRKPLSWLPIFRTRYGVIFGKPLQAEERDGKLEEALVDAMVALHSQLRSAMDGAAAGGGLSSP